MLTTMPTVNPPAARPPLHERALAVVAPAVGHDPHAGTIAARLAQAAQEAAHAGDDDLAHLLHDLVRGILRTADYRERLEREANRDRERAVFTVAALRAAVLP